MKHFKLLMTFAFMALLNINPAWGANYSGTFKLITSTANFTTGYYVVCSSTAASSQKALGTTVDTNKRMTGQTVTISNSAITNPSEAIVWYITVNGSTCTFKNVNTNTYLNQAATTSGKGMGLSSSSVDITLNGYESTAANPGFKFILNGSSNNYLKWNNGSSWFANYASGYTSTMTPVALYKLDGSTKTTV